MAVEIIHRGEKPSQRKYVGRCRVCHTTIRCIGADITVHTDQRDGDYRTVPCPVCQEAIYVREEAIPSSDQRVY